MTRPTIDQIEGTEQMNQITTAMSAAQIAAAEVQQAPQAAQAAPVAQKAEAAPKAAAVAFAATDGRTKTIKLQWPITVDGKLVETVELRRLTGRDYRRLATLPDGIDENEELLAMMMGHSAEIIENLDADDFEAVNEAARDFLPQSLRQAVERASATGAATAQ